MAKRNALYAQSGGVTAVINGSAYGFAMAAREAGFIDEVYGGNNGINGVLYEEIVDLGQESAEALAALRHTPGGALGSARKKLQDLKKNQAEFQRILEVLDAHEIRYFFYNGGNDSMDTVAKLAQYAKEQGADLQVLGIPKTIDNDLPITDNSPGFGSAAKYNSISMMEASLDLASMCRDSTKVFVLEAMGRHAGWIAASTGLAHRSELDGPHAILLPEVNLNKDRFYKLVEDTVAKIGYCAVTVSEGIKDGNGNFLAEGGTKDAFGHAQLGGAGQALQEMIKADLGMKVHGAILDYCQRSARHVASKVDVEQAVAAARKAVELAGEGISGAMVTIVRESDAPYQWSLGHTDASNIANKEKILPKEYIREDGLHITPEFRKYCEPLIQGEEPPPYENGLPVYRRLAKNMLATKLPSFKL